MEMGSVSLWGGKLDHAIRHKNGVSLDVGTRGRDSTARAGIELSLDVGSATLMVNGCNPGCVGEGAAAVPLWPQKRFLCAPGVPDSSAVSRGVRCPWCERVIMRLVTSDNHKSSIVA